MPAVNSSESPGRMQPNSRPVSAKMITRTPIAAKAPNRLSQYSGCRRSTEAAYPGHEVYGLPRWCDPPQGGSKEKEPVRDSRREADHCRTLLRRHRVLSLPGGTRRCLTCPEM